jgi:hypothetical protein
MEKVGKIGGYRNSSEIDHFIGSPVFLVTLATAASIIGESVADTEKLVFSGHLIGFLPFEKGGWHVVVRSLERWIGRPLNVQGTEG